MKSRALLVPLLLISCSMDLLSQGAGTAVIPEVVQSQARDNLNKGVQAFRETSYEAAIEYFKKAVELDPELTSANLYLATAYAQQFMPNFKSPENQKTAGLAIQAYEKFLQKEPTNKIALAGIAGIYQNNFQFEKAREAYIKLAEVDPQNHIPYYAVGSINWILVHNAGSGSSPEKKRLLVDEGIRYLDKALTINPDYEDTYWYENLLSREKAMLLDDKLKTTSDKTTQNEIMAESEKLKAQADEWSNRALEVRKKNAGKKSAAGEFGIAR